MLGVLHLKVDVRFDNFLEITFRVLHYHVQSVEGCWVLGIEQLDQFDYEGVLQLAHQCHLTEDAFAVCFILKDVLHPLDCDLLAGASTCSKRDFTVATCSQETLTHVVRADLPFCKLVQSQVAATSTLRYR